MQESFDFASVLKENPALLQTALSLFGTLGARSAPTEKKAPAPRGEQNGLPREKSRREVLFSGIRPYLGERSVKKLEAARVFVFALESLSGTLGKGAVGDVSDPD